jgi:hypothetical protein
MSRSNQLGCSSPTQPDLTNRFDHRGPIVCLSRTYPIPPDLNNLVGQISRSLEPWHNYRLDLYDPTQLGRLGGPSGSNLPRLDLSDPYSFFVMSCIDIKPTSDIDDTHHYHASVVYLERGAHGLHGGRQLADGCANGVDLNHRVNNVPLELCPVV